MTEDLSVINNTQLLHVVWLLKRLVTILAIMLMTEASETTLEYIFYI